MTERDAAWAAYQSTRGKPAAEQDAARLRYDAAVKAEERRNPTVGIESTRDRMRNASDVAKARKTLIKRDEWGYPVDE